MGLHQRVDFARSFAAMVRVQGPDPKRLKMRKHAFHQYNSGRTTLSASGMLLPENLYNADVARRVSSHGSTEGLVLVVTVASVVEPFLSQRDQENISEDRPKLIPGTQIDVMLEGKLRSEKENEGGSDKGSSRWCTAQLISLVDIPVSSSTLQSLVEASLGSQDHGWEVGWSLASHNNGSQIEPSNTSFTESHRHSGNPRLMSKSNTRIAILGVPLYVKDLPNICISPLNKRGDFLLAVGSPFGVLSPVHFFNSISVGSIANCYPPGSSTISLLMADIRCLPGMEGGPVFGEAADFVGILIRPLRQKSTAAEIQLVIPWEAIATACSDLLLKEPQNVENGILINKENLNAVGYEYSHESDEPFSYKHNRLNSYLPSPLPIQKAMSSVCLITIDESMWASGVLLNSQGLILTNAHLLEPWRFGKTTVNGGREGTELEKLVFPTGQSAFHGYDVLPTKMRNNAGSSLVNDGKGYELSLSYKSRRNIRVRFDHVDPWIWCDAKVVYVCKGPLDVALLQLEYVPDYLCPMSMDFACPPLGSKAYVIGHGLFGPRSGILPSVCSGVVAKIVEVQELTHYRSIQGGDSNIPAMLETTAAVHPGGSGGAVINSEGHMIGLVTSNARHGGGTVIPHLNFSIPCAVLTPIFEFARDMHKQPCLQNLDRPDEHLSSVWALMPPLSPKRIPPLPNLPQQLVDKGKHEKGSRFAKFMAESDKLLGRTTRTGNAKSISNEILRSKL